MAINSPAQTELLFSLDTPELVAISPRESYLKGWFVPPETVETWRLMVLVDGKEEPVYTGFPRPDVRHHVGVLGAGRSGFIARLWTPEPGQAVSLIAQMDGAVRELVDDIGLPQRRALPEVSSGQEKVSSYEEWIFQREPQLFSSEAVRSASAFSDQPTISLLVEFEECPTYFLSIFLRTLAAQIYPHWQLCIAGDFSARSESFEYLRSFAATDGRVMLIPASSETDSARVWNAALEAAEGDFIAPLRLYDELHPFAFWEVVNSLQGRELDLVYSDEDRVDLFGGRRQPQFKPEFDGEHLLSINYVGYLTAIRRSLAHNSGGFRSLPSSAREWDFLLRCVEQTGQDKVAHIAKPLYRLRTREALAEAGVQTPSTQPDDLCQVIRDHVTRTGKRAMVQPGYPTDTIRLKYQVPSGIDTSIFLRDEDGIFQMAALAELVNKHKVEFYGVLNGIVHRLPWKQAGLPRRPPIITLAETMGRVFVFINRPIDLLSHFFLEELIAQALRPDCGLVAGLSVDLEGRFMHTGFVRKDQDGYVDPFAGSDSHLKVLGRCVRVMRSVRAISGDFFAVRREHVEDIGGFAQLSSIPQFVQALTEHAHRHQLKVLVTPYSIGTFDRLEQQVLSLSNLADWNPNLDAFSNPYELLQS